MTKIELYTWALCPFCVDAKKLLEEKNIPYTEYKIDGDDHTKRDLYESTGQHTVPFIFINGNFIGGYAQLKALADQGKLEKMLE